MFSYFEPNFIEKISLEKCFFFQILAKIKMTQNKNRLFGRHFLQMSEYASVRQLRAPHGGYDKDLADFTALT